MSTDSSDFRSYSDYRSANGFVDLKLFDDTPGIPNRVVLYEGLPHHQYIEEVFRVEHGRTDTIELDGYPFYTELLPLRPEDTAELTAMLGDRRLFWPHLGGKRCGDFHPDYCLEWGFRDLVVQAQICLGCYEVKAIGPAGVVHGDIPDEVAPRRCPARAIGSFSPPAHRLQRPAAEDFQFGCLLLLQFHLVTQQVLVDHR